jgi:hypothetical protein
VEKSCENCMVLPQGRSLACLNCAKEKIQTLESELQQYKEALRLACKEIVELQTGFCKDGEEIDLMNICLTQAKGG